MNIVSMRLIDGYVYCFATINDKAEKEIMGKPSSFFGDNSLKNLKSPINLI